MIIPAYRLYYDYKNNRTKRHQKIKLIFQSMSNEMFFWEKSKTDNVKLTSIVVKLSSCLYPIFGKLIEVYWFGSYCYIWNRHMTLYSDLVQGVQEKLCFFTIHCNPSLAYIAEETQKSTSRDLEWCEIIRDWAFALYCLTFGLM